jgi:hypothetical protein
MKPICLKCQRFYRAKKNGYAFIEGMPLGASLPGTEYPEGWVPYKLWVGDLWVCQGCGHELVAGVARLPRGEHYEPDFEEKVKSYGRPLVQINDC